MSPKEKECIEDSQKFVRSYEIITSLYDRVLQETGDIPHSMVMDKVDADRLYAKLKKSLGTRLNASSIVGSMLFSGGKWTEALCDTMYNRELNKAYGLNLHPESGHDFKASNWYCNTSYAQAKANLREIVEKYEDGRHSCPKSEEL